MEENLMKNGLISKD